MKHKGSEQYGGCICGAVKFTVTGLPERVTVCHCAWCQRRTGTAFGTEVVFLTENVSFTSTSMSTYRHHSDESGRWVDVHFCTACGTNLGLTVEVRDGIRSIPAGAFDDPEWVDETGAEIRHVYTRSQRHWGNTANAVKTFEAYFD